MLYTFYPPMIASPFYYFGLARVFFSWTLHAIVYFWLMPAHIAFYTIVPRAIGGRLYSDTMGRASFAFFLVFSMPVGIHHLFADPQVGAGFKFVHAAMTAMVTVPTLLTVFTITASVEIAARLRGGQGLLGWVRALPWAEPAMLAVAFSFVMSVLFVWTLATARRMHPEPPPFTFSVAAQPSVPPPLNGFALWVGTMIALTVVNYGWPIAQIVVLPDAYVPIVPVGSR